MTPLRAVPCPHSPPVHGKLHSKQRSIAPQAAQGQVASRLLWDSRPRSVGPFSNSRSGSHSGAAHHHASPRNCGSTRPGSPTDEHQHQQGSFLAGRLQSSVPLRGSVGGIPVPGTPDSFFLFLFYTRDSEPWGASHDHESSPNNAPTASTRRDTAQRPIRPRPQSNTPIAHRESDSDRADTPPETELQHLNHGP